MAITHRKGDYNDYDPSRMRPAEFGVTLANDPKAVDGKAVHIAFAAGEDKTLMTFEDAETMIEIATEEATEAATSQAQQYATNSANSAKESRSYAKGGTSSRSGEDTDNAMYYKNQAASSASSASSSASQAANSMNIADQAANAAFEQAQTATAKADEAAASAQAAATSATNASSSATAASGSATEASDARDAAVEAAEQAEAAASQSAAQASIAEVYDATKTYAIGDYCLHDGQLYECTTEISTPEAWTAAHWTATTAGTELNDIQDDVSGLKEDLMLQEETIPDTVQTITFDSEGNVSAITHTANNVAVRTDAFTFGTDTITEVRTLSTGESLTIVTNTTTLQTTVTYAAA